jgi:two-component system, OmpR family, phosphate regulon response regulator OmpR
MSADLHPPVPEAAERPRLLHIDDDEKYCRFVVDYLGRHGYSVTTALDGTSGLQRILSEPWDLVILDVMLPDVDGFQLLRQIRAASAVPVLMLTARGDEPDRIDGLEFGADDYVPKIFSQRELLARITAVLRRVRDRAVRPGRAGEITIGRLRIHPAAYRVFLGDAEIVLTPVEFAILLSLARSSGQGKSRAELVSEVTDGRGAQSRMIDVHVFSLRKKLGESTDAPRYIRTVRNLGYMLVDPDAGSS